MRKKYTALMLIISTMTFFSSGCASIVARDIEKGMEEAATILAPVAEATYKAYEQFTELSMLALNYYNANNRWPSSMEELDSFYPKTEKDKLGINLEKYKDVSFEILNTGEIQIEYTDKEIEKLLEGHTFTSPQELSEENNEEPFSNGRIKIKLAPPSDAREKE